MRRKSFSSFPALFCVASLCLLPQLSIGQVRSENMNFIGLNICLKFAPPTDNPHAHPEWQDPVVHSAYQIRTGRASHQFMYGRAGNIEVNEELVEASVCSNLTIDRAQFSPDKKATFCISLDKEHFVRVDIFARGEDKENLDGILSNMHGISTCQIGNLSDTYTDGARLSLGKEILFQPH